MPGLTETEMMSSNVSVTSCTETEQCVIGSLNKVMTSSPENVLMSSEQSTLTKHVTTLLGDLGLADRLINEAIYVGDCHNRTRLLTQIGGGSFGEIYLGEKVDNSQRVAVKVELQHPMTQYLLNEGNTYRKLEGVTGIPKVHWYGLHGNEYTMMVMELLGSTLYERWVQCGNKFSMKTVLMLIDQMLTIIQRVHQHGIVHRDLSVSNFMFGNKLKQDQVHLIDFGHARKINQSQRFIPAARRRKVSCPRPLVGTPRFASVFTHMGQEEGYRDDLESLAYIWIYLLKGRLPWQGQRLSPGESKLDRIAYIKLNTRLESLCEGLPDEFLVYMNYVRRLKPSELPDHQLLIDLFRNLATNLNVSYDWKFDWTEKDHVSTNCNRG
jgi:serine/threonine protein kinase